MTNYTARDVATSLRATSRYKKVLVFKGHVHPVLPLQGSTFKTGKHGSGKTRFLLKDFFTGEALSVILDSDEKFTEMEDHPGYKTCLGVITEVGRDSVTVTNQSYEKIRVPEENREVLKKCEESDYLTFVEFSNQGTVSYKIKSIQDVLLDHL